MSNLEVVCQVNTPIPQSVAKPGSTTRTRFIHYKQVIPQGGDHVRRAYRDLSFQIPERFVVLPKPFHATSRSSQGVCLIYASLLVRAMPYHTRIFGEGFRSFVCARGARQNSFDLTGRSRRIGINVFATARKCSALGPCSTSKKRARGVAPWV
jgi:hypothetical protein